MENFNNLDIEVFSIFILLCIILDARRQRRWNSGSYPIFTAMIAANIMLCLLDVFQIGCDGSGLEACAVVLRIVTPIGFLLNPLPCMLWSLYADHHINGDAARTRRMALLLSPPMLLSGVVSLLSVFGGYYYYFDSANVYHRGELFPLLVAICYFYIIFTLVQIVRSRNRFRKKDMAPLVIFALPPTIAGILQTMVYGVNLIWPAMTLSMLIVYLYIQNDKLSKDHLTKVYNRNELDNYLEFKTRTIKPGRSLAGIMLDLDDFKSINDKYGHLAGDRALEQTAAVLRKCFRDDDFIARYAGDEFVVILEAKGSDDLDASVARIHSGLAEFNAKCEEPYRLRASVGAAIFEEAKGVSAEKLLDIIDQLMYEDKKREK